MNWAAQNYTHTGLVRKLNEDSLLDKSDDQLWVVADGMGGHEAGDYASQHVIESLKHYQRDSKPGVSMARIISLLDKSNRHQVQKAASEQLGTVGCTVATLSLAREHVICSWSGDSRIYRLRSGKLLQLTRDHNYGSLTEDRNRLQFPVAAGADSELLTAAIGGEELLQLEHCWFALQHNDRFLLCTDGLYKEMEDHEIEAMMNDGSDPEHIVSSLADLYRTRGARDNVGIIYVYSSA